MEAAAGFAEGEADAFFVVDDEDGGVAGCGWGGGRRRLSQECGESRDEGGGEG